jgi:hypothetical protein
MNTVKAVVLAGLTALSLGMGTAMAQEGGSTDIAGPDYWAPSSIAKREAQAAEAARGHSGLYDAAKARPQNAYPGAHTSLFSFGP